VDGIEIYVNQEKGNNFLKDLRNKRFLFSFVISYTETCEIPGITNAGSDLDAMKFTAAADAEFLYYGHCKSIKTIPMTPDGKPTPAILTKVALESASIPHLVVNAGSKIVPKLPFFETGLLPGKNITQGPALESNHVLKAVDYGRIMGRTLGSCTDCLVIGESIPGGTTTGLAVMKGLGFDGNVSSSMAKNPILLKNQIVENAMKRFNSEDPFEIMANLGDPMIPVVAGILSAASQVSYVLLAGGTQMAAVLAFAESIGYNKNKTVIGTTSYILDDKTANFVETTKKIADVPILSVDPQLGNSTIKGLNAYSEGFVKEGAGAGGSMIAARLKTGIESQKLLSLIEKEYQRVITSQ